MGLFGEDIIRDDGANQSDGGYHTAFLRGRSAEPLSEWFDGGFQGIGEKVVKTGMDAVTKVRCIIPSDPENLLDEFLLEDNPALCPFQDGDFVGIQATAAPKDQFTAVNLVSLETVCHFHLL